MDIRNNKAFTIVEMIVIIAIIGILVLFGMPKLMGYVGKAQLTRIQHDVKIMQDKMETVLSEQNNGFNEWDDNAKDLGVLILRKQLYENSGVVKKLDKSHIKFPKYNWSNMNGKLQANLVGYEDINGNFIAQNENLIDENLLGVGGPLLDEAQDGYGYKVIPDKYKTDIKTRLKGTFYSNEQGKVYYEPNKPLTGIKPEIAPNCVAAETLDYVFEHKSGTIVKYNGKEQYLIIPEAFLAEGQCWPVRIIGKGAFARNYPYPPIKNIVLPPALEKIEEDAFKNNEIEKVIIPPGVTDIGPGAFNDNPLKDVVIQGPSGSVNLGNNSFGPGFSGGSGGSGSSGGGGSITYRPPSNKDVGLIVSPNRDKNGNIITGSGGRPTGTISSSAGSWGNGGSGGSSSSGGSNSSGGPSSSGQGGKVVIIPDVIIVDGKEVEITEIAQGAFQGEGLIHVTLPSGLEIIEDYAFAGNQLVGIDIPQKVNYIGNYAFGFNELYNGKDYKWTIGYINFKSEEQINKVNKNLGNIEEGGSKINKLKDASLLDHIWINSNSEMLSKEEGLTDFSAFLTDKEKAIMKEKVESLKKITLVKTDKKIFNAKIKEVEDHLNSPKALKSKVNTIMKELIEIINNDSFYIIGTSGKEVHWVVPVDGVYEIGLKGGSGGSGGYASNGFGGGYSGSPGGAGQTSIGLFKFKEGDIVTIYQGEAGNKGANGRLKTGSQGTTGGGGNGGGGQESYVKMGNELLISAQGGQGGRGARNSSSAPLGQGKTFNSGEVVNIFRNVANSQTYVYRIAQ